MSQSNHPTSGIRRQARSRKETEGAEIAADAGLAAAIAAELAHAGLRATDEQVADLVKTWRGTQVQLRELRRTLDRDADSGAPATIGAERQVQPHG